MGPKFDRLITSGRFKYEVKKKDTEGQFTYPLVSFWSMS